MHTVNIEVSCCTLIKVAISLYGDKRRAQGLELLAVSRAGYEANMISLVDEMFCNGHHGYDVPGNGRAAHQHKSSATYCHSGHKWQDRARDGSIVWKSHKV